MRPAPAGRGPRVYVETYGCQMNVADSDLIGSVLAERRLRDGRPRRRGRRHPGQHLRGAREGRGARDRARAPSSARSSASGPGTVLAIVGCMAEHLKEGLAERAPAVDVIAGPD